MGTASEPFLACYDYGQGAIWLLMDAESTAAIESAYPFLRAFASAPAWMSPAEERHLRAELIDKGFRWSVDAEPSGWLLEAAQEQLPPALPAEVEGELSSLLEAFKHHGFKLVRVLGPVSFGNFFATWAKGRLALSIVRDRGQFHVSGPPRAELESAGLWRAFASTHEMAPPLEAWLRGSDA